MSNNVFTVDLGKMTLTDKQRETINSAIQKAVLGVVSDFDSPENFCYILPKIHPCGIWRVDASLVEIGKVPFAQVLSKTSIG